MRKDTLPPNIVEEELLHAREEALGHMHPDTARSLNNLATCYYTQRMLADAEPLMQRAIAIRVFSFPIPP